MAASLLCTRVICYSRKNTPWLGLQRSWRELYRLTYIVMHVGQLQSHSCANIAQSSWSALNTPPHVALALQTGTQQSCPCTQVPISSAPAASPHRLCSGHNPGSCIRSVLTDQCRAMRSDLETPRQRLLRPAFRQQSSMTYSSMSPLVLLIIRSHT